MVNKSFESNAIIRDYVPQQQALGIQAPSLKHFRQVLDMHRQRDVSLRYLLTAGGQEVVYRKAIDIGRLNRAMKLGAITVLDKPSLPGNIKHGSRAEWVLSAQEQGVDEVLLCAPDGEILEANRSAFFAVKGGIIVFPPCDNKRLESITLGAVKDAVQLLNRAYTHTALYLDDQF